MVYTQIHIHNSKYTRLQAGNSISIHSFLFTGKRVATPPPRTKGQGGHDNERGAEKLVVKFLAERGKNMFENMTTQEIATMLDNDPELKEKAKLNMELLRMFETLPEERQTIVIDHIKDRYPEVALELERIRDEKAYFSAFGDMVVVEERQGG